MKNPPRLSSTWQRIKLESENRVSRAFLNTKKKKGEGGGEIKPDPPAEWAPPPTLPCHFCSQPRNNVSLQSVASSAKTDTLHLLHPHWLATLLLTSPVQFSPREMEPAQWCSIFNTEEEKRKRRKKKKKNVANHSILENIEYAAVSSEPALLKGGSIVGPFR